METPEELGVRAELTLRQRSLDKLSASVTDPQLRSMAREFASGRMRADEFVRRTEQSAPAMRGLDRVIKHYMTLSPEDLAAAKNQHQRNIDQVAAELTEVDQAARRTAPAPRVRRPVGEEDSWENKSWLE
ncbi:MAG TPA: hypothetical protein VHX38_03600 [Pseudonocardiaceae bacterium]|jgi:hypothetical protein|nr:hypothetical protein [Pseudonocardiaceae bacterium]